jgi:hypothetical protein
VLETIPNGGLWKPAPRAGHLSAPMPVLGSKIRCFLNSGGHQAVTKKPHLLDHM